jgi:uncharacterized membrane protein
MQPKLASNSRSAYLSFPNAGITDVSYHAWLIFAIFLPTEILTVFSKEILVHALGATTVISVIVVFFVVKHWQKKKKKVKKKTS